jgi:hypothetical protein
MNVLQDFYDLRHDDNFFNDLFENVWYFDKFLFLDQNFNWSLLKPIHNLKHFFDVVNVSDYFLELLDHNCLFNNRFDFPDGLVLVSDFNDLLIFSDYFFDLFNDDWDLYNLLHDVLNVSVDVDDLGDDFLNLHDLWNFDHLLLNSLNFVDFGNSVSLLNYFFDDLLSSDNLLNNALDWDDFLNNSIDFYQLFSNVRNFLHYFPVLDIVDDLFFNSWDLSDLNHFLFD